MNRREELLLGSMLIQCTEPKDFDFLELMDIQIPLPKKLKENNGFPLLLVNLLLPIIIRHTIETYARSLMNDPKNTLDQIASLLKEIDKEIKLSMNSSSYSAGTMTKQ